MGRLRPVHTYANIRRWLLAADERRSRTIWQTMRKLTSMFSQRSKKDQSFDFLNITQRTVNDWKSDSNPLVQQMGSRLAQMLRNP